MGFAEAGPTMIALPEPNDRERRARIIGEWLLPANSRRHSQPKWTMSAIVKSCGTTKESAPAF